MERLDAWGAELTAPAEAGVDRYNELVDAYVTFAADLPQRLGAALAEPGLPMATIAFGLFVVQANTAADHERAMAAAASLADIELNSRETEYLGVLRHWVEGNAEATLTALEGVLERWPTDMFALRLQHFALFAQGRPADMVTSVERAIDAWGALPRRSYLDGMLAFPLEEMGRYDEAERLGRDASDADPGDLWSIHSVAHVLEMQGRTAEGLRWFEGRDDDLHRGGSFARHLWWHHAIIHLRTGDYRRLLDLYDAEIQPADAVDALSFTNAVDALARLEFAGVDVGVRWAPLVEPATLRLGHHDHVFFDCHAAYALARAGADDRLTELLDGMAQWRDRDTSSAKVVAEVGLTTATAMAKLGSGHPRQAASLFRPTRGARWRLGGSHAQRRVFDLAEEVACAAS